MLHHDLLVVIGQLEDDVFEGFPELQLVEGGDALRRHGDTIGAHMLAQARTGSIPHAPRHALSANG